MRKSMLLTLFLTFLLAATLQVRLTAKPLTEPKEPPPESVAVTDEKPPADRIDSSGMNITRLDAACNSVVIIACESELLFSNQTHTFKSLYAGVIVDPRGYIVTICHHLEKIKKIQVKTYDGKEYNAQVVGHDQKTDIALIKITPDEPLVPIRIGDSGNLKKLQRIVMVGHPFGYSFSCCNGEIVGLSREIPITENLKYDNAIVISASISSGMSGGPLLTFDGEMVGLTVALRQTSIITDVAVPSDFVMEVAAKLLERCTKADTEDRDEVRADLLLKPVGE